MSVEMIFVTFPGYVSVTRHAAINMVVRQCWERLLTHGAEISTAEDMDAVHSLSYNCCIKAMPDAAVNPKIALCLNVILFSFWEVLASLVHA